LKEPPRHDRVALYHYYKKFWKQFNLPDDGRNLHWDTKDEPRWGAGERVIIEALFNKVGFASLISKIKAN
jgi:hypothetical protein